MRRALDPSIGTDRHWLPLCGVTWPMLASLARQPFGRRRLVSVSVRTFGPCSGRRGRFGDLVGGVGLVAHDPAVLYIADELSCALAASVAARTSPRPGDRGGASYAEVDVLPGERLRLSDFCLCRSAG
jgi:hypothetical protein